MSWLSVSWLKYSTELIDHCAIIRARRSTGKINTSVVAFLEETEDGLEERAEVPEEEEHHTEDSLHG